MMEILTPLKELAQSDLNEPVRSDNFVFRLHSRLTVLLLTGCAILVSAKQFVGEPITCITHGSSLEAEPVNAYCWIYSTFTVRRHLRGIPGREVAAPGVAQARTGDEILQHRYYQWVCLVLVLQALAFYTPRALWRSWEAGLVKELSGIENRDKIIGYFVENRSIRRAQNNLYALKFFCCEILNFLNTLSQMYLLDVFLEGQFRHYGPEVISSALTSSNAPNGGSTNPLLQQRLDPMARLFPKLAKCTLHTFGPGGSSQTHDALCVLPLNVVNEKIFVFLWFWLIFLAIAGALALFYRVTVLSQPWARRILLRASARGLSNATITSLQLNHFLGFGDWFLLRRLAADPLILRTLADALAKARTGKTGDLDTTA